MDGKVRKRRRKPISDGEDAAGQTAASSTLSSRDRECPVPKPGGRVGQMMGFEKQEKQKPMEVIVKSLRSRNSGQNDDDSNNAG